MALFPRKNERKIELLLPDRLAILYYLMAAKLAHSLELSVVLVTF